MSNMKTWKTRYQLRYLPVFVLLILLGSLLDKGMTSAASSTTSDATTSRMEPPAVADSREGNDASCQMGSSDIRIVYSDVDGTLVHYPDNLDDHVGTADNEIIRLPPSATGLQGVISTETFRKCQEIRRRGKKLVLISGMRSTTLWKRIPYLPRADAYCCEAGGRIFYPKSQGKGPTFSVFPFNGMRESDSEPFWLEEDQVWRSRIEPATGPESFVGNELESSNSAAVSLLKRTGVLWAFCRELQAMGYTVDLKGYSTCFRVNRKQQGPEMDRAFDELLASTAPDGLASSVNLGCVDFYPSQSGKRNCCQYLVRKLCNETTSLSQHAVCVCDDDNDLEMALACKHAFVPGVSSESMAQVLMKNSDQITVTGGIGDLDEGTDATERALGQVLKSLRTGI